MTRLQEYYLDIKLVHTIKGHGLCKLETKAVKTKEEEEELIGWEKEIKMYNVEQASPTLDINSWYTDVCQYLDHGTMRYHLYM